MGFLSTRDDGHLESVVYFLSEALRAAIEAGDSLQQSACAIPQIGPGMDCAEIAEKLAGFRQCTHELWSCEAMMIAKILRARDLAKELRLYELDLRPEIDTFRLATVSSADLQDLLLPDAQNLFNGSIQPKHFMESRGFGLFEDSAVSDGLPGYKVAGRMDVRLLLDACEALHFGLAARYGFDSISGRMRIAHSSQGEGDPMLLGDEADSPFLLTDFGEMLTEAPAAMPQDWRGSPGTPVVPH